MCLALATAAAAAAGCGEQQKLIAKQMGELLEA